MLDHDRFLTVLAASGAVLLMAGAQTPLAAQSSTTRGFNVGVHLEGASITIEDGEANGGGGLGLRFGYGINRIVTLYAELDGAAIDVTDDELTGQWGLAHFDLGARFHFANSLRRWVPYLETAIGGRAVSVNDPVVNDQEIADISFNGGSFTVGGGLYVFFTESWALDVAAKASFGQFTEIDVGNVAVQGLDIDATSGRFKVGVVWWK